jgi:glycerol-3-phosphate O-acyltransferase
MIPITINYERTMESTLYSSELLGERKIKESLKNLLLSSPILNSNFGKFDTSYPHPSSIHFEMMWYCPSFVLRV